MTAKAKVLNIEIGDRLTKVCCTVKKKRTYQILESFMFQMPDGYVTDGVVENPEALAGVLRAQLDAHGLGDIKNVIFALSSGRIASREVKLPPMKEKLIADVIRTNATDYFPVDLTNYHVTYSLVETVKGAEPGCRVNVMAAPVSLLAGYFNVAKAAGLSIQAIDASGNSHYQALKGIGEKSVTMYIDVDCTGSFVSFMQGDNLLMQRTFAYGGDEMIARYMVMSGKSADQYLEALRELTVDTGIPVAVPAPVSEQEVETSLGRLVSSVARSIDYFNSNHWEIAAQQIVLMGPCGKLVGLRELITAATGLPTMYIDELPGAVAMTNSAENASCYISCIGSSIKPVDLMPQTLVTKGKPEKNEQSMRSGVFCCSALVFLAIVLSAFAIFKYQEANRQLEDTKSQIESLEYAEDVYLTYLSYQKGQAAVQTITGLAEQPNSRLTEFYKELEKKMPSSILLLSATCTNEGVSMNVTTGSYTDAAAVIKQFRSFESISVVDVTSVSRADDERGGERVSFSVTCTYGTNPYLNGTNPYGELVTPAETGTETDNGTETEAE